MKDYKMGFIRFADEIQNIKLIVEKNDKKTLISF